MRTIGGLLAYAALVLVAVDARTTWLPLPLTRLVWATTAGAAHIAVTPYFSTRRRISAPSILRITTCSTPIPVMAKGIPHPLAWNIGSVCR